MILTTPDFSLDQLDAFLALRGRLEPAGLRAGIITLDTGEAIALHRPRDPDLALWLISPTEGDRVVLIEMPSGADREHPSIAAAVNWAMAFETNHGASISCGNHQ